MTKDELIKFAQDQLARWKEKANGPDPEYSAFARGKVPFFEALLAGASDTPQPWEQLGLLDAVNDTFQKLGKVSSRDIFYKLPPEES